MSDRELLELAAKAAGYPVKPYTWSAGTEFAHEGFAFCGLTETASDYEWNPLEDDGDALRLAVKLDMQIWRRPGGQVCGMHNGIDLWNSLNEPLGDDPYAATRRAIVRAAAEMAKVTA